MGSASAIFSWKKNHGKVAVDKRSRFKNILDNQHGRSAEKLERGGIVGAVIVV
jgi:hypothetical protein